MVNTNYTPDAVEDAVIDVLRREERANPFLIREETDELSRQQINNALRNLVAAGWVDKRTRGLYDYVDDPRGEGDVTTPTDGSSLPPALDDAIAAWEPDKQIATATAQAALRDAVTWLGAHGGDAKKAAIVEGAWPGEPSVDTWWGRAVRPGLAALAEAGLVDRPTNKTYRIEK